MAHPIKTHRVCQTCGKIVCVGMKRRFCNIACMRKFMTKGFQKKLKQKQLKEKQEKKK